MEPNILFSTANVIATSFWLCIILIPGWSGTKRFILSGYASLFLCLVYLTIVLLTIGQGDGGFFTLDDVMRLFDHPLITVAAWVHYLAFDLFVGCWVVLDARKRGIKHLYILPSLFFTLMYGPIGLLVYFLSRWIILRKDSQSLFST